MPQPRTRDKLISAVRRNSRLASLKVAKGKKSAQETVSDSIFNTWSESKLKEFLDKNNVKVPQGSTKNDLLALARRNKAYYSGDTVSASLSSAGSAASSVVGEKASQATDAASSYANAAFDKVIEQWSDTRLKAYLDSRGVPVPQASKRDELLSKVRLYKHKASTGFGAWTFDTWTTENLRSWLEARGQKISSDAANSRDQLYSSAVAYYSSAASAATPVSSAGSKITDAAGSGASRATDAAGKAASYASDAAGSAADAAGSAASQATDSVASAASAGAEAVTDGPKQAYASLTSALAQATASIKDATFDTWSDSDLKSYLDTYSIKTYQGTTRNEMIAMARRNAHYFRYGSQDPGYLGHLQGGLGWVQDKIGAVLGMGGKAAEKAGDRAYEEAQSVGDAAKEKATKAYDYAKEEL